MLSFIGTIGGTVTINSNAYIEGSKIIATTNKVRYFSSEVKGNVATIIPLSKGKYLIEGAGGKDKGDFVEYTSSARSTYIYTYINEKLTTIFTADVDSSNTIEYTANSDTELQISVGQGAEGCYNTSAGGNCSHGSTINLGDGYVQITTIE